MTRATARSGWMMAQALRLGLAGGAAALVAAGPGPAAAQTVQVDVPAGPLSAALNRLAAQTGLQIAYDSALTAGRETSGLSGAYAPRSAVQALVAGSGLEVRDAGPGAVSLAAAPAAAGAVSGASGEGVVMLDTVVIRGEKSARDRFSTYSSVGVATGEQIAERNIQTLDQALDRMANVTSQPGATGDANLSIRGLNAEGVTQPSRAAPVISVIVDGAQQGIEATRRGSRGVWDVEQVEVLRGPQSTLQGRNALGGAVIVETRDPTWEPEVIVEGELGSQERRAAAFAVSAPILEDQIAFRLAGQATRETKDIDYADPRIASLREDEFEEIRGKLLIEPEAIPELSALFTVSRTHDKPGWNAVSGPDYFDREFNDASGTSAEFRDTYVNRYIAEIDYDLPGAWSVTSVTAFSDTDVSIRSPRGSVFGRDDEREAGDLSQDLRVNFDSPDSPFSGVFGLFAGRFKTDLSSSITTTQLAPYGIPVAVVQDLEATNETTNFAAYADLRYDLTERLTLLAGGRLLREKVSADYAGSALDIDATLATMTPVYGSLDEDNSVSNTVFLPKAGAAFDLTEDHTLAATVSRGYRAGFSEAVPGTTTVNEVDPEYLWSYELAWRSRWLEDRLEIDANAFWYDYENQQILTMNPAFPGQTVTENSGESHAYGLEIDARWQATETLELFGSLGLLKTEFDEGMTAAGSLAGSEFPESPTVTAAFGGVWRHRSGAFAAADISYTGEYYSFGDVANTPARQVDPYTLVNAQVGYEFGRATVAVYARNLFDEDYLTSVGQTGAQASVGDGRIFGVRLRARF